MIKWTTSRTGGYRFIDNIVLEFADATSFAVILENTILPLQPANSPWVWWVHDGSRLLAQGNAQDNQTAMSDADKAYDRTYL